MALTKITSTNIQPGAIESSSLETSGAAAGTYGAAAKIPVLSVNAQGIVFAISEADVAGVSNFAFNSGAETLTIDTADGSSFTADISALASETYVDTAVSNLVDTAPEALNTLNELAAALGDDANFATTVSNNLGNKVDKINITGATVGSGTEIPVITFNAQGQITSASTTAVAGIDTVTFSGGELTISTGDGSDYVTDFDARYFTETEANNNFLGINAKAADSDLLDGLSSTQFLRSDQNDAFDGDLTLNGTINKKSDYNVTYYKKADNTTLGYLLFRDDGSNFLEFNNSNSGQDFRFLSNNSSVFTIESNGNVGIGATAAGAKLEIKDNLNPVIRQKRETTLVNGNHIGYTEFYGNEVLYGYYGIWVENASTDASEFRIFTGSGGSTPNTMKIDSTGNVGFSNTDPNKRLDVKATSNNVDGIRLWREGTDGDETNFFTNIGGSNTVNIFKLSWKRITSSSSDLRFNPDPTNITDGNSFTVKSDNVLELPKRTSDPSGSNGQIYYNTNLGAPRVKTPDGWVSFGIALGTIGNPVTSIAQAQANSLSEGLYYFQNDSGQIQELYYDPSDGGWMLVASNDARDSVFPAGTGRHNLAYTVRRNGTLGQFGTADPNADYLIGSWIDNFSYSRARGLAWGWGSTNGSTSWTNRGTYVDAQFNATSLTQLVARGNVSISGTGSVYSQANWWMIDAIQKDYDTGGFNANTNQTTIGMAGVNSSSGDPSSGTYYGHGTSEESGAFEGWYNSGGNAANSQGWTTWVR